MSSIAVHVPLKTSEVKACVGGAQPVQGSEGEISLTVVSLL